MTKEILKKRKTTAKKVKNNAKNDENDQIFAENSFSLSDIKLLCYIKTLFSIKRFLPNIIKLVDKQIFHAAETSFLGPSIFADHNSGTYGQVEMILEMEQRKLSLINMGMLIDELYNSLDNKYKDFVYVKLVECKSYKSAAEQLEVDERTCYRWNKIVLIKLLKYCKLHNFSVSFFAEQLKQEKWLAPHFEKYYKSIVSVFGKS